MQLSSGSEKILLVIILETKIYNLFSRIYNLFTTLADLPPRPRLRQLATLAAFGLPPKTPKQFLGYVRAALRAAVAGFLRSPFLAQTGPVLISDS